MQKLICPHCNEAITLVVKKKAKPKEVKPPKEDKPMTLEQFQKWCEGTSKKELHIIGAWATLNKVSFQTVNQWNLYISRNIRAARSLSLFTDEQIQKAFSQVEEDHKKGLSYVPALETLILKLTK